MEEIVVAHVHPQMGFIFFLSLGIPAGQRKYVRDGVIAEIDNTIDPGHAWRNPRAALPPYTPPSGYVEEDYIKDQLDIEVPQLAGGGYNAGYQVDLCYVAVGARVICDHCYGLLEDYTVNGSAKARQVSVTVGGNSVDVLVYYSY